MRREAEGLGRRYAFRMPDPRPASLAPEPDFRHVTLVSLPAKAAPWALAGATAALTFGVGSMLGWREAICAGVVGTCAMATAYRARRRPDVSAKPASMSIVPWGVIVDEGEQTRVLRWAAIERIDVETIYGRDQASDVTRHSVVFVQTDRDRLVGSMYGAAPLDRLLAHREAYAREAEHVAAIDLDGGAPAGEVWEPQVERLLLASGELLRGGGGGVNGGVAIGYRGRRTTLAAEEVAVRLREILADRTDRSCDPRPLGVILAAELGLHSLAPEIAQLVSSPHPLTAAAARAAGTALGIPKSRLGVLEEVAPFLPDGEVEALSAWAALRSERVR